MNKYIKLEDAKSDKICVGMACIDCPFYREDGRDCGLDTELENLPSIEIVHCKDCEFYDDENNYCEKWEVMIEPKEFCSFGKEFEE